MRGVTGRRRDRFPLPCHLICYPPVPLVFLPLSFPRAFAPPPPQYIVLTPFHHPRANHPPLPPSRCLREITPLPLHRPRPPSPPPSSGCRRAVPKGSRHFRRCRSERSRRRRQYLASTPAADSAGSPPSQARSLSIAPDPIAPDRQGAMDETGLGGLTGTLSPLLRHVPSPRPS